MNTSTESLVMTDYGANFGEVLITLLAVIVLIFVVVFFLKKISITNFSKSKHLSIITELPISSKDRIMIIQAGEEQFLVSASPGYMNKISRLKKPITVSDERQEISTGPFDKLFAKALKSEFSNEK